MSSLRETTDQTLSITRTFFLTHVEQPAVPSRRMFLCCSSGFSCITVWECGDSLRLPLEIQRGSATHPVRTHCQWPSPHLGLGLNSAFLSCHTCLSHTYRLHLYSSNSCQPLMAGSQVSTRSMVSELHVHLPYGQPCSNVSRRLSWAEAGNSYGNIFCVSAGFAKRPVLIIHLSS